MCRVSDAPKQKITCLPLKVSLNSHIMHNRIRPNTGRCQTKARFGLLNIRCHRHVTVRAKPIFVVGGWLAVALAVLLPLFGCEREPGMRPRCIDNLLQIQGAKNQWMTETKKATNDVPTWDNIRPYLYRSRELHCPKGGVYTIGRLDERPRCSIGGKVHTLP